MSLNPSNQISQATTGLPPFPNVAGLGKKDPKKVDEILVGELIAAAVDVQKWPESLRQNAGGEPQSIIFGSLHGWTFQRAWYYWVVKGPGIPLEYAQPLHESHGTSVRCLGDCTCPSPLEAAKGFPIVDYHVDNPEGLRALTDTIRQIAIKGAELLAIEQAKAK